MLAEDTARLYGLYPRKGRIQPGADADLTGVDPEAEWSISNGRHALQASLECLEWRVRARRSYPIPAAGYSHHARPRAGGRATGAPGPGDGYQRDWQCWRLMPGRIRVP